MQKLLCDKLGASGRSPPTIRGVVGANPYRVNIISRQDACPCNALCYYAVGEGFSLPRFVGVDVLGDPRGHKVTFA